MRLRGVTTRTFLLAGCLHVIMSGRGDAGQFDAIRSEVQQAPASPTNDDDDDHDDHDHHQRKRKNSYGCNSNDGSNNVLGDLFVYILLAPFQPRDAYEIQYYYDDAGVERTYRSEVAFASYPYAGGHEGYWTTTDLTSSTPTQLLAGRIRFEFGSDFDGINRYAGKLLLESTNRWGLDADWNYYTEHVAPGVQDQLHLGDVNLLFRVIETPRSLWRLGVGGNWFHSGAISDSGINTTLKADFFPTPPVIVSGELDYGRVGDAEMFHGAVLLGLNWRRVEIFSGYDYRKIGRVTLDGPLFGLRLWW